MLVKTSTSPWSFSAGTSHITKTRTSGGVGTSNGPQAWMPVRMVAYVLISLCDPVMNGQLVHKGGQVFPLGEAGRGCSSRLVWPLQAIVMVGLQNKDPSSPPWLEISKYLSKYINDVVHLPRRVMKHSVKHQDTEKWWKTKCGERVKYYTAVYGVYLHVIFRPGQAQKSWGVWLSHHLASPRDLIQFHKS